MSDTEFEQAESRTTPPPRRKQGGLMSVLGLLLPVLAGGVTVFGAYFLFLEDWLKKPTQKKAAEIKSESIESEPAEQDARIRPAPRPAPIAGSDQPRTCSQSQAAKDSKPKVSAVDQEKSAENALSLAKKMLETKPSAATSWFRKVVDRYPNTKAAKEAEAWLKQHSPEP